MPAGIGQFPPGLGSRAEPSALGLGHRAAGYAREALPQKAKSTKAEAQYVEPASDPAERCEVCTMFRAPSACTAVEGAISPDAHCRFFEARV